MTGVAITPDGRRAVSASWDDTLRVWDLESGPSVRTLEGHSGWVNIAKTLLVHHSRLIRTLEGHSNSVTGVAITPDGRRAVSASDDNTLRIWDLESGQTIRTLEGHSGRVSGVAITPDGRRAISASGTKRCGCGTWRAAKASARSKATAVW